MLRRRWKSVLTLTQRGKRNLTIYLGSDSPRKVGKEKSIKRGGLQVTSECCRQARNMVKKEVPSRECAWFRKFAQRQSREKKQICSLIRAAAPMVSKKGGGGGKGTIIWLGKTRERGTRKRKGWGKNRALRWRKGRCIQHALRRYEKNRGKRVRLARRGEKLSKGVRGGGGDDWGLPSLNKRRFIGPKLTRRSAKKKTKKKTQKTRDSEEEKAQS